MLVEGGKIVGAADGLDGGEGDVEDRLDEGVEKLGALGGDDLAGDADALAAGLESEATFGGQIEVKGPAVGLAQKRFQPGS